jgi:hypothetical protein
MIQDTIVDYGRKYIYYGSEKFSRTHVKELKKFFSAGKTRR